MLRYGLDDVFASPSNYDDLQLTPEQRRRIADLHRSFASLKKSFTNTALGQEPDSRIGEVFDLSGKLGPPFNAELMRREKELNHQLRNELSLDQLELAEGMILRERARLGGIRAIVASDDLREVTELARERSAAAIDSHLRDASQKATDQIREIRNAMQELTVTHIDDSFPPPDQGPEFQAKRKRLEREFDSALRSELEPFQIELAEDLVLRERFKFGGLRAVVESTDLPDVAALKIEGAPVESRLKDAAKRAGEQVDELHRKYVQSMDELKTKARKIQEREIDAVLKDLGSDGDKLKRIMAQSARGA